MFAPLSDVVTCPRCGPAFGLIMLADRVADRRAHEAWLGCANCRERYQVKAGFADLRFGAPEEAPTNVGGAAADAARLAALMGVAEGPALLLIVGAGAVSAAAVADLIPGIEVVAAWSPLEAEQERAGVSRFATLTDVLPYRSASMSAVALTDAQSIGLIEEAARVVVPRARIVVESSAAAVVERIERAGLRVLAKDERATVAQRTSF